MVEVKYVSSELLNSIGIKHGWFMRYGGVSEGLFASLNGKKGSGDTDENVDENRKRAFRVIATSEAGTWSVSAAHIIHEFKNNILRAEESGEFNWYDASYTEKQGLVLSQTTADCASVIIADSNKEVVALVHGSWHTLSSNIICDTIAKIKSAPGVGEFVAGIGPMICRNCYEFGPEAKDIFDSRYLTPANRHFRAEGDLVQINSAQDSQDKYLVDLKRMVIDQLNESGISKIDDLNICTKEDERFFSHRRSGSSSGRMITLAQLD